MNVFFSPQSHYVQQARRSRSVAKKRKREASAPPTSKTRSQSASRPPRDQSGLRDTKVRDVVTSVEDVGLLESEKSNPSCSFYFCVNNSQGFLFFFPLRWWRRQRKWWSHHRRTWTVRAGRASRTDTCTTSNPNICCRGRGSRAPTITDKKKKKNHLRVWTVHIRTTAKLLANVCWWSVRSLFINHCFIVW